MNPHQKNKIDLNSLTEDEQRLFRLYGKVPNRKDLLQNKLKERKYFDSGDYALSKAGKASDVTSIGTEHPSADNIHHASPLTHTISRSDSISQTTTPSLSTDANLGPSPAGIQRGSINGIPGGGLPMPTSSIGSARSPAKESYLSRSESVDEAGLEGDLEEARRNAERDGVDVDAIGEEGKHGIPIRR